MYFNTYWPILLYLFFFAARSLEVGGVIPPRLGKHVKLLVLRLITPQLCLIAVLSEYESEGRVSPTTGQSVGTALVKLFTRSTYLPGYLKPLGIISQMPINLLGY